MAEPDIVLQAEIALVILTSTDLKRLATESAYSDMDVVGLLPDIPRLMHGMLSEIVRLREATKLHVAMLKASHLGHPLTEEGEDEARAELQAKFDALQSECHRLYNSKDFSLSYDERLNLYDDACSKLGAFVLIHSTHIKVG